MVGFPLVVDDDILRRISPLLQRVYFFETGSNDFLMDLAL